MAREIFRKIRIATSRVEARRLTLFHIHSRRGLGEGAAAGAFAAF